MLMDNTADILLDNIMRVMSGEYFGQTKAAAIVGGKKKTGTSDRIRQDRGCQAEKLAERKMVLQCRTSTNALQEYEKDWKNRKKETRMKKILFIMWISLLAVPTLMTFTLDNEGHITYLNVIGLVYSICTAFLWERMMPGYMVRYIKKLIRED